MYRQWSLRALELVVLWSDIREVNLPAPFTYTSKIVSNTEGQRELRRTREHLRSVDSYGLGEVLDIVAKPDLRLILHAWEPGLSEDPEAHIRIHAVRRGQQAYLLEQKAGGSKDESEIQISECDYLELAGLMTKRLPEGVSGKHHSIVLDTEPEGEEETTRSWVREPWDDSNSISDGFFREFGKLCAVFEAQQGLCDRGPQYRARSGFRVVEIAGDGRYVMLPGPPQRALGADVQVVENQINNASAWVIAAIRQQRN